MEIEVTLLFICGFFSPAFLLLLSFLICQSSRCLCFISLNFTLPSSTLSLQSFLHHFKPFTHKPTIFPILSLTLCSVLSSQLSLPSISHRKVSFLISLRSFTLTPNGHFVVCCDVVCFRLLGACSLQL